MTNRVLSFLLNFYFIKIEIKIDTIINNQYTSFPSIFFCDNHCSRPRIELFHTIEILTPFFLMVTNLMKYEYPYDLFIICQRHDKQNVIRLPWLCSVHKVWYIKAVSSFSVAIRKTSHVRASLSLSSRMLRKFRDAMDRKILVGFWTDNPQCLFHFWFDNTFGMRSPPPESRGKVYRYTRKKQSMTMNHTSGERFIMRIFLVLVSHLSFKVIRNVSSL